MHMDAGEWKYGGSIASSALSKGGSGGEGAFS